MIQGVRLLIPISVSELLEKLHIIEMLDTLDLERKPSHIELVDLSRVDLFPWRQETGLLCPEDAVNAVNEIRDVEKASIPTRDYVRLVPWLLPPDEKGLQQIFFVITEMILEIRKVGLVITLTSPHMIGVIPRD